MKTEKYCRKCRKKKPYTEFYTDKRYKDGHLHTCKVCKRKYRAKYGVGALDGNIGVKYVKPVQFRNKNILDVNNAPVITF